MEQLQEELLDLQKTSDEEFDVDNINVPGDPDPLPSNQQAQSEFNDPENAEDRDERQEPRAAVDSNDDEGGDDDDSLNHSQIKDCLKCIQEKEKELDELKMVIILLISFFSLFFIPCNP